jgi:hypothetical protein
MWGALVLLFTAVVGAQMMADAVVAPFVATSAISWIRSAEVMQRLALEFDVLVADVYWVRAVQFYGDTKLSKAAHKNYDSLYPLLDMTTTLDPDFKIAYRFGAILLSEGYPNGPARPDAAIALLEKGIRRSPERWEYYYDAGMVEYWWREDYRAASEWFLKAGKQPAAPEWLPTVAASMLARGGSYASARMLWTQIGQTAEQDWLRQAARRGIMQIDAEEQIDALRSIEARFAAESGHHPGGWVDLVRAGRLRGVPIDPTGMPYTLDPASGAIDVAPDSALYPLKRGRLKTSVNP